jgi:hypothetical protein
MKQNPKHWQVIEHANRFLLQERYIVGSKPYWSTKRVFILEAAAREELKHLLQTGRFTSRSERLRTF